MSDERERCIVDVNGMVFRELPPDEEREFRAWARANYTPGDEISNLWHPVVRDECARMTRERDERRDE